MKQIKIGRSKECDIQVSDSKTLVSRVHAIIEMRNSQYFITDYSTNGTYVNGREIQSNVSTPIHSGDTISLANESNVNWYEIDGLLPMPNVTGSSRATEAFNPGKHIIPPRQKPQKGYSPSVTYASWGARLGAYLLDGFFLTVLLVVVFSGIGMFMRAGMTNTNVGSEEDLIVGAYALFLIIVWIYYAGLESGSSQGTWGKQIVGIKVVDVSTNSPVSFAQATGRFISRLFLGFIPIVNFLDYMAPLWNDKKQAWHDNWSSCAVIDK